MELECPICRDTFERSTGDYNRSKKLGRLMFCSLKCAAIHNNTAHPRTSPRKTKRKDEIELHCDLCGDKFMRPKYEHNRNQQNNRKTLCCMKCAGRYAVSFCKVEPFKYFMKTTKNRNRRSKGPNTLTVEYLKEIFESQKGLCACSGIPLILPRSTVTWNDGPAWQHASVDRIDNDKGYAQGNVRFVCHMYNIARARYDDDEVIQFCEAVVNKNRAS